MKVLFIAYQEASNPIVLSQVHPYVAGLAESGFDFFLLTFETGLSVESSKKIVSNIKGISKWDYCNFNKHSGVIPTVIDIITGIKKIYFTILREKIRLIHARGVISGIMALLPSKILGVRLFFDSRGLLADKYVGGGLIRYGGIKYKCLSTLEYLLLRGCDYFSVETQAHANLISKRSPELIEKMEIIPSCVDISRFTGSDSKDNAFLARHNLENRFIFVYLGKIGTWYMLDQMLDFFATSREIFTNPIFLFLTPDSQDFIVHMASAKGLSEQYIKVVEPAYSQIPEFLKNADCGITFINPYRRYNSSPIKFGEYLASGLPVVINAGIGDTDKIIEKEGTGVIVRSFSNADYLTTARQLKQLFGARNGIKQRCKYVASKYLLLEDGIKRYQDIYSKLLNKKMKILFIVPYPKDSAPSQRLKFEQYLDIFKSSGIEFKFRPFMSPRLYKIAYVKGKYLEKAFLVIIGYISRIKDICSAMRCDVVYLHLEACPFGLPVFEYLFCMFKKPIIYDIDDIVYFPHSSRANKFIQFLKCPMKIPAIIKLSSHIIVVTDYLKEFSERFNKNVTLIPPTINTDKYFVKNKSNSKKVCVGWTGSRTTSEYLLLLEKVLKEVAQRYDIRIKVIGDRSFRINGLNIEAKDWSSDTEAEDIQDIDIGLYPLPNSEWVMGKGGLKALQYMGIGIPVVCTRIGAVLDFIQDGLNGFLADTEKEWIGKLSLLIESHELRSRVGMAGRKTVEERYSVKVNAQKYLEILHKVYNERYGKRNAQ